MRTAQWLNITMFLSGQIVSFDVELERPAEGDVEHLKAFANCQNWQAARKRVLDSVKSTGREIIAIDLKQLEQFAGNVLQLQTKGDRSALAISTSACLALRPEQRDAIQRFTQIVESPLPLFEAIGRGSG